MIASILWPAPPPDVALQPASVHVWAWNDVCSAEDLRRHEAMLSAEEQARAGRFLRERDRVGYAVNHGIVRCLLAQYLNAPPQSLLFSIDEHGKPQLAPPALQFNLSHSGGLALLAVSSDLAVGVDVEAIRPIEAAVAERFFSAAEQVALATLSGSTWLDGFYQCWTRKEAVLKAEGVGLHGALDAFDVSLGPEAKLLAVRPGAGLMADWQLVNLEPAAGFAAALALTGSPAQVCCYQYQASGYQCP